MIERLESKLGYQFNNKQYLELALSHRSVGKHNNERLEFLGDSLLGFIIAEALFLKFPEEKEGNLTRLRSQLVKGETLAEVALEFDIGEHLLLGEGELKSGGFRRASILADSVEAILGGIYLDGGMAACKSCVLSWYQQRLDSLSPAKVQKDPKTQLQEYLQQRRKPLPDYKLVKEVGEAHAKQFVVECTLKTLNIKASASETSKRGAEKLAAQKVLHQLGVEV